VYRPSCFILYTTNKLNKHKEKSETYTFVKGTVSRNFFLLFFFHESVSHKPLIIPLRPFRIFSKIRGDTVFSAPGLPPVSLTPVTNGKNPQSDFYDFFWTPLGSRVSIYINFCLQAHF